LVLSTEEREDGGERIPPEVLDPDAGI